MFLTKGPMNCILIHFDEMSLRTIESITGPLSCTNSGRNFRSHFGLFGHNTDTKETLRKSPERHKGL